MESVGNYLRSFKQNLNYGSGETQQATIDHLANGEGPWMLIDLPNCNTHFVNYQTL